MLATIVALAAAHVLADFVLQPRWIIHNKRRPQGFLLHVAIVGLATVLLLGPASLAGWSAALLITISHALVDATKTFALGGPWLAGGTNRRLVVFLLDQAMHFGFILIAAGLWATVFADGWWPMLLSPAASTGLLLGYAGAAGFVVATRAGGFGMAMFMVQFSTHLSEDPKAGTHQDPGLPNGGAWIGWLERALVFLFVLIGQFSAIGFLVAAKSILRFQHARERSQGEIVIIGTLASFAWAVATAQLTDAVLNQLQ